MENQRVSLHDCSFPIRTAIPRHQQAGFLSGPFLILLVWTLETYYPICFSNKALQAAAHAGENVISNVCCCMIAYFQSERRSLATSKLQD